MPKSETTQSEVKIEFQWSRAYSNRPGRDAYTAKDGKLHQTGEAKSSYAPLKLRGLYLEFAQLDMTPESCVGFATKYGLLREAARTTPPQPFEDLADWRKEIRKMAQNLQRWQDVVKIDRHGLGTFVEVGIMEVFLAPGEGVDARPVLVMQPKCLLDAMKLEMAQYISSGNQRRGLVKCRGCDLMFQAGAGGKRTVARFHSDECRIAFNNAKRSSK
jgi:hypothetical protein